MWHIICGCPYQARVSLHGGDGRKSTSRFHSTEGGGVQKILRSVHSVRMRIHILDVTSRDIIHSSITYLFRDVKHVADMDNRVKASANFAALFWQCQLHISQVCLTPPPVEWSCYSCLWFPLRHNTESPNCYPLHLHSIAHSIADKRAA